MTSDVGALSLPGWRDPLDKTLKLLGKSLGRRISGLGRRGGAARMYCQSVDYRIYTRQQRRGHARRSAKSSAGPRPA